MLLIENAKLNLANTTASQTFPIIGATGKFRGVHVTSREHRQPNNSDLTLTLTG